MEAGCLKLHYLKKLETSPDVDSVLLPQAPTNITLAAMTALIKGDIRIVSNFCALLEISRQSHAGPLRNIKISEKPFQVLVLLFFRNFKQFVHDATINIEFHYR